MKLSANDARKFTKEMSFFYSKDKFLAAVSGGPDSMAMLSLYKNNISVVCHVNYNKRPDSKKDETIVRNFCKQHKIKCEVLNVTPEMFDAQKDNNFQSAARKIRYDFFVEMGEKHKIHDILIAHNLDDFLETAIMQKNRKSVNFFYGIKKRSKYKNLSIYRPLITKSKKKIQNFCDGNQIPYAIDSSNESDIYERNRVRKSQNKKPTFVKKIQYNNFCIRNFFTQNIEFKTKKYYRLWASSNFDIKEFYNLKKGYHINVLYLYLKHFDIKNVNKNKIKLLANFVLTPGNESKTIRIENKTFISKSKGKLIIRVER